MANWLISASFRRSQQLFSDCCVKSPSVARTFSVRCAARVSCAPLTASRTVLLTDSASRAAQSTSAWSLEQSCLARITTYSRPQISKRQYTSSSTSDGPKITATTEEHSSGHNFATLTVSNPAKLNIVNSALLSDLIQKCQHLSTDSDLRAVVLTGGPTNVGKAASFIGGADIKEMIELFSSEQARAFIDRVHAACEALRNIPVPVIARIDGFCLGAGMEIAASCDLRIATRGSVFGMPEVKVGIPSVVEAAYLPGLIGMGRTRRLLYLAENIDAAEAERWGFVERLVDGEVQLDSATEEWVDLMVGMGPKAIRSQKRLMQRWENCSVEEGIEAGAVAYAEAFADGGKEPKEFMGRFVGRKR